MVNAVGKLNGFVAFSFSSVTTVAMVFYSFSILINH